MQSVPYALQWMTNRNAVFTNNPEEIEDALASE